LAKKRCKRRRDSLEFQMETMNEASITSVCEEALSSA
jgi:hypothetical protein